MSKDDVSLNDIVARYLRRNPAFLSEYPDVLEALHLNHQTGPASSLIERQVAQLRRKNHELNRQLSRLMHVASENEQLMARLHQLTLELMTIEKPRAFFKHLAKSLRDDFKADIVKVCLFEPHTAQLAGDQVTWVDPEDEQLQQFQSHLSRNHTVCGRLNESKLKFLFDSKSRWVQSTALVPLGEDGSDGIMAIGSSDPARFYPGMGTLFLDLLADVIASSLSNSRPQEQRLTA